MTLLELERWWPNSYAFQLPSTLRHQMALNKFFIKRDAQAWAVRYGDDAIFRLHGFMRQIMSQR